MPAVKEKPVEADVITPAAAHKVYVFGPQDEITLVQKPLSFFGKLEFFSLVGKAVEKALENDTTVAQLLNEGGKIRGATLSAEDFNDADQFMRVLGKLATYAPELILDLYVIALGVPKGQRDYIKSVLELHPDDGGPTDEQGAEILETFVDQNWDVMVDFFKKQILPLVEKVTSKVTESAS